MNFAALRDAAVDALQQTLGSAARVQKHGGRFTLEELKQYALQGPAVLVAVLAVGPVEIASQGVEATLSLGAFVVVGDKPQLPRDTGALALTSALVAALPGNDFGVAVDGARKVRGDNLYNSALDRQGVALWAVTWQQEVALAQVDPDTLDDFLRCHVDYDINQDGTTDVADAIDVPQ